MKPTLRYIAVLAVALPTLLPADSPMFRANAAHTGIYDTAGVPAFDKVKWRFHTDGRVYFSLAVVKGTVYFGSTDDYFYAVDGESGKLKWRAKTRSLVSSSPVAENGTVYFASFDGFFYASDAETGKLKWKFQTAGKRRFTGTHLHGSRPVGESMPNPFDFYLSSPTVWDRKVNFGSGDGNVYALDGATGKLAWRFKTGDVVHASPAIADGTPFTGSWDSYFYTLDPRSRPENVYSGEKSCVMRFAV